MTDIQSLRHGTWHHEQSTPPTDAEARAAVSSPAAIKIDIFDIITLATVLQFEKYSAYGDLLSTHQIETAEKIIGDIICRRSVAALTTGENQMEHYAPSR